MSRPRIAFLSSHNALDRNSFSGTTFFMRRALLARAELAVLGERVHRQARGGALARLRRRAGRKLLGIKDVDGPRRRRTLLAAARRDLASGGGFDAVLGIVSSELLPGLAGATAAPLIHVTDATPAYIAEEYGLPPKPGAAETEARVIAAARAVVYSSHYMADRARAEFGAGLAPKLHVVPFGLNMDAPPAPRLDLPAPGPDGPLRLVFVGKKWARKGGDIALDALRWLRGQGIDARLTVLGARPPGYVPPEGAPASAEGVLEPGVTVIPFLDKNRPEDAARFDAVLGAAHLMILPTRADCTPMVVAEANAFGAPVLATDVGGLGTLIVEGENGALLPEADGGAEWGRRILDAVADPAEYGALRGSSLAAYRDRLTWEAWSDGMLAVVAGLSQDRGREPSEEIPR